ncbi:MAG: hypothetical protein V3W18_06255 [candidate division Zixibacteria bacterium]
MNLARMTIFVLTSIIALPQLCFAQSMLEELRGRYKLIYDSTYVWPDGRGGYDYVRKFVSEVVLAAKGRDVLSKPATPIIDKNDDIEITAYTVLPSGDVSEVESADLVSRDFPDGSRRIFVNFRQPEPGAVLHFEWVLRSGKGNTSGYRYFARTIDVDSSVVVITAPETWIFNFIISPECNVREAKSVDKSNTGPALVNYTWTATNLKTFRIEEYSPPVNRAIPALYFSLSLDISWDDPESQTINWGFVAGVYYDQLESFLKKSSSVETIAESLMSVAADDRVAAGAAFNWVRSNFRSQVSDISLSDNLDETLERGRGSQAEAAAIFYAILSRMNIPCAPYLAASRDIGVPLTELPALFWFDRVLVACFFENETVWADPFYLISDLGILPFEDQNIPVLRLDTNSGKIEHTPEIDYHENGKAIHLRLDIDSTGALYGEATEIYSGAMIPEISSYLTGLNEGQRRIPWERKLAKSFPGVDLMKFVAIPPEVSGDAYRIGYTFTTGPIIRQFATRAYIPLDLLGRWEDLPSLPPGERKFPIEIRRPRYEFERITLNISDAFEIEFTPKNYSLNSIIGEIYSVVRKKDRSITITRGFGLKRTDLPVSSYNSLIKFFNAARTEADKQIILSKRN